MDLRTFLIRACCRAYCRVCRPILVSCLFVWAACFDFQAKIGHPCGDNGLCPEGQVCDAFTQTCQLTASGPPDAGAPSIDAADAALSDNDKLASLVPSIGRLMPGFSPGETSYNLALSPLARDVQLAAQSQDSNATVTVHMMPLAEDSLSPPILIDHASAFIPVAIKVKAPAGNTRDYGVDVIPSDFSSIVERELIRAENGRDNDNFGWDIAVDGAFMVVGATYEGSCASGVDNEFNTGDGTGTDCLGSGAAYIFRRKHNVWEPEAYLKARNPGADDEFGVSVAIDSVDGSADSDVTVVVGAFHEDSKATGTSGDFDNDDSENSGAAYVFRRIDGNWRYDAYLKPHAGADVGEDFGWSVAVAGDRIAVGARRADAPAGDGTSGDSVIDSGVVYTFVKNQGLWTSEEQIVAPTPEVQEFFGSSLALVRRAPAPGGEPGSGQPVLVVGACGSGCEPFRYRDDNPAPSPRAGRVYVWSRSIAGVWNLEDTLEAQLPVDNDGFGVDVAMAADVDNVADGGDSGRDLVVVGAWERSIGGAGRAYVFGRSGTTWSLEQAIRSNGAADNDRFGAAVSLSQRGLLAVGASAEEGALDNVGAAYLFAHNGTRWTEQRRLQIDLAREGGQFGRSVALGRNHLIVGVPYDGAGAIQVFE